MDLNKSLKRDTIINYAVKIMNMGISFLMVRYTLNYLGELKYGIWAIILSVITIVAVGDLGIGNGLKNRIAESLALENEKEIKEYISTAYICISIIALVIFIIGFIIISLLNFELLNYEGVRLTLLMMVGSICANFILSLVNSILMAYQRSGVVSFGYLLNSIFLLIGIFIISLISKENIVLVGIVYVFAMIMSNLILSILFFSRYPNLMPKSKYFTKDKVRNTVGISIKFFILQFTVIVLSATDNIIITSIMGPKAVTPYDAINKVYNNINTLYATLMFPIWSAVTYAYTSKDFQWIKSIIRKLKFSLVGLGGGLLILGALFNYIIIIWLKKDFAYSKSTIAIFSMYVMVMGWNAIYTSIVNGIGKINTQLVISIIIAVINIPLSIAFVKYSGFGVFGVKLSVLCCQMLMAVALPIQVWKELKVSES